MRFPSFSQLSREQLDIYGLPLSGNYLVVGPPGTGKTVMAVYRGQTYKRDGQDVQILMYGKVLSAYTRNAAATVKVNGSVSTYHSWFFKRMMSLFNRKEDFQVAPYKYRWDAIKPKVIQKYFGPGAPARKPTLLVDEGQDLPPVFYELAGMMNANVTVFADENQRLDPEDNSTLSQIRRSLVPKASLALTRNYRNTREIAQFAACCHIGDQQEIPKLPDRSGELPLLKRVASVDDAIAYIARFARNHPELSIGVLLSRNRDVNEYVSHLKRAVSTHAVRSYTSGADVPDIDGEGILVLNYKSAKGLEFDAVFLPELHAVDAGNSDQVKMNYYVMCSRARDYLFLLHQSPTAPKIMSLFSPSLYRTA